MRSWVEEAAEYARSVADNKATFRYTKVPGGGWSWTDKYGVPLRPNVEPDVLEGTDFSRKRCEQVYNLRRNK